MRAPLREYLEDNPNAVLIMDGGQGTELENRGISIAHPVWSTLPFIDESFWREDEISQNRKIVKSVYDDFIEAGSDILMTTTYQASFKSISENTCIKTLKEYNQLLDRIVHFSREAIGPEKYLVGCIGPWGAHICAEFTGDYGDHPASIDYFGYLSPQIMNFNEQDEIDIIGFETIPSIHELNAILSWDESIIKKPFYISLSVNENGTLRDGTTFKTISDVIRSKSSKLNRNLIALGINCCSFNHTHEIIEALHVEIPDFKLVVYPNSGEVYDTVGKLWLNNKESTTITWDEVIPKYISNGARIIGGCCRTTPNDIKCICAAIKKQ